MARTNSYTYDPKTGTWSKSTTTTATSSNNSSKSGRGNISTKNSSNNSSNSTNTSSKNNSGNLTSSTSNKNSSSGATEKQYNDIEINTLSGTLSFIVTEETIKLKAGDTVSIKGIGKYLSGNYYVKDVTRSIGANGYSHSATIIRTDFGDKLKTRTSTQNKISVEPKKDSTPTPTPTPTTKKTTTQPKQEKKVSSTSKSSTKPKRTYKVKKGDCLWNIAKKFYGRGSKYKKIYSANTGKIANPNKIYPGQVLVIP